MSQGTRTSSNDHMPRGWPWLMWLWSKSGSEAENCVRMYVIELLHMPTIFLQVCAATKKKGTCLIYVCMYRYVNICCDVYYHVSGNENVEQWPYAQRLTLASVAQGQSRVPWQKNCVCTYVCNRAARICVYMNIVKHMSAWTQITQQSATAMQLI